MKRASIDIGTNSVLLLVAEKSNAGLNVLHEVQELPRLGDVILAGIIILSEFLNGCDSDSILVSTGGIRHGVIT